MYKKMIAVTNRRLCKTGFISQIGRICALHPKALVLREKDLDTRQYVALARKVMPICKTHGVPFIAHGNTQAALLLGCMRLHLPLEDLRRQCADDPGFTLRFDAVGASCHSTDDILEAARLGAGYVFLGNIFETQCKPQKPAAGLDFLRDACAASPIPVYAIGGVNMQNMPQILECGAAGGCMMSGFISVVEDSRFYKW